ncbi:hypothetical protein BJ684DRAFT_14429 [Piptocephalis cylindrospora]|uniref:Phosphatidate phosphatase APP1 catalytic domain-containing protein n=1 Tax=Piptocephalis cylindrospora TaxID=1907219 RepID=A0A4P9YB13_9FUNG|nr:hypothetical protein BJ684DRAFT_14429 [Piptocephalis cylindrospora]|eukprot:RKP15310.1 hypothetical protein BJ684DRAFT_14429 [Piptocephalis cylindrospora]
MKDFMHMGPERLVFFLTIISSLSLIYEPGKVSALTTVHIAPVNSPFYPGAPAGSANVQSAFFNPPPSSNPPPYSSPPPSSNPPPYSSPDLSSPSSTTPQESPINAQLKQPTLYGDTSVPQNGSISPLKAATTERLAATNQLLLQTTSPYMTDDKFDVLLPETTEVLMYPTWATNSKYDTNNGWFAYMHGVVFKRHSPSFFNRLTIKAFSKHYGDNTPDERDRLKGRLSYFFADHSKRKTGVSVMDDITLSGSSQRLPRMSLDSDGHFNADSVALPGQGYFPGDIVQFQVRLPTTNRVYFGRCHLYGSTGWSILTDIDDTIKDTRVPKYAQMFRKAFMEKYEAVPGMVDLFQYLSVKLATQESPDVGFHYISGTPFALMPSLDRWLKRSNFPPGPVHLAKFRIKDPSTLYNLPKYVQFKVNEMGRVHKDFPRRKFILFGDSGQGDEKAYAQLMKSDGGDRYQCMFIRLVSGIDEAAEYKLNRLERWVTSLSDIPQTRWRLFRDPKELYDIDIAGGKCHPDAEHAAIVADIQAQKGMLVSEVTRIINSPAIPLATP